MHNAPSVSYPVGRPLFAGLLATGLWTAGVAVTWYWLRESDAPGWRQAAGAFALGVSGAWSLQVWLRSPRGEMHWDGAGWTAPHTAGTGSVEVALDLQQVMLVRWLGAHSAHWIWLERGSSPQRWLDLRRAVYSRARPPALSPARPPAATP